MSLSFTEGLHFLKALCERFLRVRFGGSKPLSCFSPPCPPLFCGRAPRLEGEMTADFLERVRLRPAFGEKPPSSITAPTVEGRPPSQRDLSPLRSTSGVCKSAFRPQAERRLRLYAATVADALELPRFANRCGEQYTANLR